MESVPRQYVDCVSKRKPDEGSNYMEEVVMEEDSDVYNSGTRR